MNRKFILLLCIIFAGFAGIAIFSSKETAYLLLDASQLAANPAKFEDDNLRVRGFVKVGTLLREGKKAKFELEFNDRAIPVHFTGATLLPDAFKEGARARVDGKWEDGVLVADHVEAKCASKYEADYAEEN